MWSPQSNFYLHPCCVLWDEFQFDLLPENRSSIWSSCHFEYKKPTNTKLGNWKPLTITLHQRTRTWRFRSNAVRSWEIWSEIRDVFVPLLFLKMPRKVEPPQKLLSPYPQCCNTPNHVKSYTCGGQWYNSHCNLSF